RHGLRAGKQRATDRPAQRALPARLADWQCIPVVALDRPELPQGLGATVTPSPLCFMSGRTLAAMIRARTLSARELMTAQLEQIARVNPRINAIVAKLDDQQGLALADEADRRLARGEKVGPLHGIPWAFKDLEAAIGFPNTQGSPIYKDFMPTEDTTLVGRLRAAGGSSGGAGAAIAAGLLPLGDGSDLGGSLRNPANFNNVTAIRPTVGLVPTTPSQLPLLGFGVKGPLGRSVDAG